MPLADFEEDRQKRSPLPWIILIVVVLIVFLIFGTDRGDRQGETAEPESAEPQVSWRETGGQVDREDAAPSGAQARELIRSYRQQGGSYPFDDIMARAADFSARGDLADAYLLVFFAAREGHIDAMMKMGEMSDPTLFRAEDSLLDRADAIQAWKWYSMALDNGHQPARERLDNLHRWAIGEAERNNPVARQLLLNFN